MRRVERVLIVLLALLCVVLAWQNHQLKRIVNRMQAKPPVLEQDEVVPPIVFTAQDGTLDSLTYDTPGVSCWVVAILKPTCPVCRK
ncbi:hypothetical protein JXA88_10685, partial [Candidatus Fermentibacteria bacterium]|nr:hypothetical protein [Candidatus Fermentibacteria bacterium]